VVGGVVVSLMTVVEVHPQDAWVAVAVTLLEVRGDALEVEGRHKQQGGPKQSEEVEVAWTLDEAAVPRACEVEEGHKLMHNGVAAELEDRVEQSGVLVLGAEQSEAGEEETTVAVLSTSYHHCSLGEVGVVAEEDRMPWLGQPKI
jgi:hypothetical protein